MAVCRDTTVEHRRPVRGRARRLAVLALYAASHVYAAAMRCRRRVVYRASTFASDRDQGHQPYPWAPGPVTCTRRTVSCTEATLLASHAGS